MSPENTLKEQADSYLGRPFEEEVWDKAVKHGDIQKCLTAIQPKDGRYDVRDPAVMRLIGKLEAYEKMIVAQEDSSSTIGAEGKLPTRGKQVHIEPADTTDTLRLQALVLHELLISKIGEHVRQFRRQFTEGRVLSFAEADCCIENAIQQSQHAGKNPAQATGARIDYEFHWRLERPLFVEEGSCLWSAAQLAPLLATRYEWRLSDAVMFLFTASVPAMPPLSMKTNAGSLEDAFLFSSVNTTPFTIKVMPWMSPAKVAHTLSTYQQDSWVGKAKAASEGSLRKLVFVLLEQHKRQLSELTTTERREIFGAWKKEREANNEKLLAEENVSRLFAATDRTLLLLTTSSAKKKEKLKREQEKRNAGKDTE